MKTMRFLLTLPLLVSLFYCLCSVGCKPEQPNVLNIRMEAAATILNPLLRSTGYSALANDGFITNDAGSGVPNV